MFYFFSSHRLFLQPTKNQVEIKFGSWIEKTSVREEAGAVAQWDNLRYMIETSDDYIANEMMSLKVSDDNKFRDTVLIGAASVSLAEALKSPGTEVTIASDLQDKKGVKSGKIELFLTYTEIDIAFRDDLTLQLRNLSVTVINDISGRCSPCLHLDLSDASLTTTLNRIGKSYPERYSARMGLLLEFYRLEVARWEPILEHTFLESEILFKRAENDIIIMTKELVQINISDVCIKMFLGIYNLWKNKRGNVVTDFYPFMLESYLGVPISLLDSKTSQVLVSIPDERVQRVGFDFEGGKVDLDSMRVSLVFFGDLGLFSYLITV